MKEARIRANARKVLEKEGYHLWCPKKVRYQETDVFGIYDGLAVKDSDVRFIQWTSIGNIRAREKKILKFFEEKQCFIPSEVWGMREDNTFRIINI